MTLKYKISVATPIAVNSYFYFKLLYTRHCKKTYKPFIFLIPFLAFLSCHTKSQNNSDKLKAQELFKETIPTYTSFINLKQRNVDSAKILSNILIDKYQIIYQLDNTSKSIGDFFSDCYKFNKEYDKQIFWDRHQLLLNTKPLDKKVYFENLATAYLSLGILDSCKLYFTKAFHLEKQLDNQFQLVPEFQLVPNFKDFADNIYLKQDKKGLEILSKRVASTCQYSVEILKFILPYSKEKKVSLKNPFSIDTINAREKNCR